MPGAPGLALSRPGRVQWISLENFRLDRLHFRSGGLRVDEQSLTDTLQQLKQELAHRTRNTAAASGEQGGDAPGPAGCPRSRGFETWAVRCIMLENFRIGARHLRVDTVGDGATAGEVIEGRKTQVSKPRDLGHPSRRVRGPGQVRCTPVTCVCDVCTCSMCALNVPLECIGSRAWNAESGRSSALRHGFRGLGAHFADHPVR